MADLEQPPFLGDYVVTTRHGHKGRVYAAHWHCPEAQWWQDGQVPPLGADDAAGKWVSVLVHDGGAVSVAATDCTVIEPFAFTHRDVGIYFGDERPLMTVDGKPVIRVVIDCTVNPSLDEDTMDSVAEFLAERMGDSLDTVLDANDFLALCGMERWHVRAEPAIGESVVAF